MSKYVSPHRPPIEARGDPDGPPLEHLEHEQRIRLLQQGKKNFDPRFGNPVFRPNERKRRPFYIRYAGIRMSGPVLVLYLVVAVVDICIG